MREKHRAVESPTHNADLATNPPRSNLPGMACSFCHLLFILLPAKNPTSPGKAKRKPGLPSSSADTEPGPGVQVTEDKEPLYSVKHPDSSL